jgi:hypothetical protein
MDINELEQKWPILAADSSGYRSLRIDGKCIPDLFIGLYQKSVRCLILKLPPGYAVDFQSTEKANLSIELFAETRWIVLKLLDNGFADLFNDLILSLYNKLWDKTDAKDYSSELIRTFHKWSEFFDNKASFQLPEHSIKGLFGELIVLSEFIKTTSAAYLNDLLNAWKGPYNTGHDFILEKKNVEVKTRDDAAIDVHISSEYQLEPEAGKDLELSIVSIIQNDMGLTLHDLVLIVKDLVIAKLGDFTVILKALSCYGLNIHNLREYDRFKYNPISMSSYNCCADGFPKIVHSGISPSLNNVTYNLRINQLGHFLVGSKSLIDGC